MDITSTIKVSKQVRAILKTLKKKGEHKSLDSVIRSLLSPYTISTEGEYTIFKIEGTEIIKDRDAMKVFKEAIKMVDELVIRK